jgi:N-acetylmuramoyl-L-alanine amidase
VQRIRLRLEAATGSLVPLSPLARAVSGQVSQAGDWVELQSGDTRYRFLIGTQLVHDGTTLLTLPATSRRIGDTVWVPLAFVSQVLADPARRAWTWNPGSVTLEAGPPVSPLIARPVPPGSTPTTPIASSLRPGHRVTIDPGHGGTDPGNPGVFFPSGLKEKHVTLAIGLLVRDELVRRGVRVTMTRTTDTLINLGHRAPRYCRDDCDLFVSLHVNSLPKRAGYTTVRGFETYFQAEARSADAVRVAAMENDAVRYEMPDEDERPLTGLEFILKDMTANEYLREAGRAAQLIQARLATVHDGPDRGVKQAPFAVLNTARRPSVLIEMGFSTSPEDSRLMTTNNGQRALSTAIADAIVEYLREFDRKTAVSAEAP